MMPSTPPRDNCRGSDRRARRGFTLTEMLVVIGIIVLVLSIATPMVTRAWRAGDRTRTAADLQAIASALEAYKTDHGSYPQVARPWAAAPDDFNGARMLCRALIAPGPETHTSPAYISDGKGADVTPADPKQPGPGFRTRGTTGRVYGPYLPPERFKLGDPSGTQIEPGYLAIVDRYNRPILYYPATGKPNIRLAKSYTGERTGSDKPMYNTLDNKNARPDVPNALGIMLGDWDADGMIEPGGTPPEAPAFEGPFILWCAGPDEVFGPPAGMALSSPDLARKGVEKSDDVTNFRN